MFRGFLATRFWSGFILSLFLLCAATTRVASAVQPTPGDALVWTIPAVPNPTLPDEHSNGQLKLMFLDGSAREESPPPDTTIEWHVTVRKEGDMEDLSDPNGVTPNQHGDAGQLYDIDAVWSAPGTYHVTVSVSATNPNWDQDIDGIYEELTFDIFVQELLIRATETVGEEDITLPDLRPGLTANRAENVTMWAMRAAIGPELTITFWVEDSDDPEADPLAYSDISEVTIPTGEVDGSAAASFIGMDTASSAEHDNQLNSWVSTTHDFVNTIPLTVTLPSSWTNDALGIANTKSSNTVQVLPIGTGWMDAIIVPITFTVKDQFSVVLRPQWAGSEIQEQLFAFNFGIVPLADWAGFSAGVTSTALTTNASAVDEVIVGRAYATQDEAINHSNDPFEGDTENVLFRYRIIDGEAVYPLTPYNSRNHGLPNSIWTVTDSQL